MATKVKVNRSAITGKFKMKKSLVVLAGIVFCTVVAATAQSQESKSQPKYLEYTGKITKIEKPDMIAVQTKEAPMEFYLKHGGGKDCLSLQDLAIGDNVLVSCKEKKDPMEARCVKKISPGATFRGSAQGVTIK
jgi:hypothetical protein